MPDRKKEWIPVAADAPEAQTSMKEVVSSNLESMEAVPVADSATGSTRVHYELGGLWRDGLSYEGTQFDALQVPEAGRLQIVGAPEIPQEGLFIAVPENANVKEVKVIGKVERDLPGEYYLVPASPPTLEGMEPEHVPNPEIYESDDPYPGKYVDLVGTKRLAGRKVAHVLVYLLQYRPQSKQITALESIDIEVTYETLPGMDAAPARRPRKSPMEEMILDSDSVGQGESPGLDSALESAAGVDAGLRNPSLRGDFLIVTTDDLKASVEPLAAAKRKDHSTKIVTKEEIVSEFPAPSPDESIQSFLKYAVDHWHDPPAWVVLAGDVDKIPTHLTTFETVSSGVPDTLASDHFYADLYGDLAPEIVISRLPESDPDALLQLCELAASSSSMSGSWRKNLLLTAYQDAPYENCADDIAEAAGDRFAVFKRYAGQASIQEVKDALNDGVVIVCYRGHGSDDAWDASNGLTSADVKALNNNQRIPLVFSIACWNGHIDLAGAECFGETWICNEKALTFLGATRPSWTYPNNDFARYLFNAIVDHQLIKVGDIVSWAKAKLLLNSSPAQLARDNVRMYVLLGDPTAGVFFVGNSNSKRLHVCDCRWVDRMAPASKAFFSSIEEAITQSYKRCTYCLAE